MAQSSMFASIACVGTLLLAQTPAYDPARHVAFLEQRFETIRTTIQKLDTKKVQPKAAIDRLGKTLGECRKLQPSLTAYMGKQTGQGTRVMKLIQAQGLFEAYLTSEILALDGDADAKSLVKVLEIRLGKLIPKLGS